MTVKSIMDTMHRVLDSYDKGYEMEWHNDELAFVNEVDGNRAIHLKHYETENEDKFCLVFDDRCEDMQMAEFFFDSEEKLESILRFFIHYPLMVGHKSLVEGSELMFKLTRELVLDDVRDLLRGELFFGDEGSFVMFPYYPQMDESIHMTYDEYGFHMTSKSCTLRFYAERYSSGSIRQWLSLFRYVMEDIEL